MADVMLKNAYGENKTYSGIETVTLPTSDGGTATFSLGGSGGADWAQHDASQNDYIKNKPFWEGQRIYIDASNTTFDTTFSAMDTTWTKITDGAFSKDELIGCVMTVYLPEDNSSSVTITEQDITVEYDGGLLLNVLNVSVWICYRAGTHAFNNGDSAVTATILEAGAYLPSDFVSQVVAMEFVGSTKLLDNKHLAILSKEDDGEYKIKEEYIPDLPHFNLVEMGLVEPNLGETSSIEIDATEIISALKQGPVYFTVPFHNSFAECETITFIANGFKEGSLWACNHRTSLFTQYRRLTLYIMDSGIMYMMGKAEPLPDVTEEDDGKTLIADQYGMWRVQNIPTELPKVTADDDGKVLSVKDGVWVAADAPAGNGGGLSTDKDILAETTVALTNVIEEFGLYGGGKMGWFSLQEGAIYNVRWDDDVYTLETFSYAMDGIEAVVLGNRNYIVDGDTEISEPFVIYYIPAEDYGVIVSAMDTEPASHIVRIYQSIDFIDRDEMIQFVDEKLANIGGGFEQVQADWDETDVISPSYIKNKPVISADGTTTVQSNYNQNDSTQADYIKNRPFYVGDEVTTEVLPATTLPFDFSESDGVYAFYMEPTTEYTTLWQSDWSKMILTWGETVYECEPKEVMGMKVIGNVDAMLGTGNTGEPFIMGILEPPAIPQRMMVIIDLESAPAEDGSVPTVLRNIAVSMVSREVHTIDPKFIADVPWDKISNKPFGDLAAGSVVVDETVTLGAAGAITPLTTINVSNMIVGAEYNITIGDATFIGYCVDANGFIVIATDDFKIAVSEAIGGMSCDSIDGLTEGAVYHVKVTLASDEVLKIDAKYLPSGLPEISASDSGKVLTVGDDGAATWSEPVSGLPSVTSNDDGKVLKVSGGVWIVSEEEQVAELPTIDTSVDEGKFLRIMNGSAVWVTLTDVSQEGA